MQRRTLLRSGIAASLAATPVAASEQPYRPLARLDVERAMDAAVEGTTAFVAVGSGFVAVDVSDPASPAMLARVEGIGADRPEGPLRAIHDLSVDGDRLAVAGPAHSSLSRLMGFALYDVSDPAEPRQVAFHAIDDGIHNCVLADGYLYAPRSGSVLEPLAIYDVREDDPRKVGEWSIVEHDDRYSTVYHGLYQLHDLWVEGDRAYLAHWDAGVHVVDVSNPAQPTHVAGFGGLSPEYLQEVTGDGSEAITEQGLQPPGSVHSTVHDGERLLAVGSETWDLTPDDAEAGGPSGVDLWNVADSTDPEKLATIDPQPSPNGDQSRTGQYTTVHNVDLADGRLYSSWYYGGVQIHDVSDPTAPERLAWWQRPAEASFWTAEVVEPGDYFVATDRGVTDDASDAGLYVFPDRAAPDADPSNAPVSTPTVTPTPESTATATATGASRTDETIPGFGVLATLAGVGIAAWRLKNGGKHGSERGGRG